MLSEAFGGVHFLEIAIYEQQAASIDGNRKADVWTISSLKKGLYIGQTLNWSNN